MLKGLISRLIRLYLSDQLIQEGFEKQDTIRVLRTMNFQSHSIESFWICASSTGCRFQAYHSKFPKLSAYSTLVSEPFCYDHHPLWLFLRQLAAQRAVLDFCVAIQYKQLCQWHLLWYSRFRFLGPDYAPTSCTFKTSLHLALNRLSQLLNSSFLSQLEKTNSN